MQLVILRYSRTPHIRPLPDRAEVRMQKSRIIRARKPPLKLVKNDYKHKTRIWNNHGKKVHTEQALREYMSSVICLNRNPRQAAAALAK